MKGDHMTFVLKGNTTPDILEVIADLSNDEVFTPPWVAKAVLDLLPEHVWADPNLRWLDPGCKTGIFLREVTKRLLEGLKDSIPNEESRLEHILTNMVFGIATTELTSLMTRRTLYCSKDASGPQSVVTMPTKDGNIWYERIEHVFENGRCIECKASEQQLSRGEERENYAYGFIHSNSRERIESSMGLKFDVIVGNPPYQMDSDGSNRTIPIYNLFVEQAKELNPKFLAMIIPSRWMAGGLGLQGFRQEMLSDKSIRFISDYPNASEIFPGVEIKGGVCYFLRERDNPGNCVFRLIRGESQHGPVERQLDEFDVLVRDERALEILRKILGFEESSMADIVSARTAFGIVSNYAGWSESKRRGDVRFYATSTRGRIEGWINPSVATTNREAINYWKALVPKAGSDGGQKIPDVVIGQPWIAEDPSICTQSFLFVTTETLEGAKSISYYYRTRFLRFLVSLRKITQDTTSESYRWVPQQTWDREWTDSELYEKYDITDKEQSYIESMIKEMPA